MILDKSLRALHGERSECYGVVVIVFSYLCLLGTGTMVDILKHVGTADWDRESECP